jgi:hypothetical protein
VDIVNYDFEWIEPLVEEEGIRLAGLKDIAAMKLAAITNRGTKKDFVDINNRPRSYQRLFTLISSTNIQS